MKRQRDIRLKLRKHDLMGSLINSIANLKCFARFSNYLGMFYRRSAVRLSSPLLWYSEWYNGRRVALMWVCGGFPYLKINVLLTVESLQGKRWQMGIFSLQNKIFFEMFFNVSRCLEMINFKFLRGSGWLLSNPSIICRV